MYRILVILFVFASCAYILKAQNTVLVQKPDSNAYVPVSDSLIIEDIDTVENNMDSIQPTKLPIIELKNNSFPEYYYDSLTYAQYLLKDYKALILTTKEAESKKIEFPYRNYRTAIAYYEQKNYAKAVKFYEKALYDVPDDLFLKESLYSAYLLSGQKVNADIYAKKLTSETQEAIGFSPTIINHFGLSGGYTLSDNKENIRNSIVNLDSINQYQDMYLGGITLGFNLSEHVKLNAGYSLFNTKFERYVQNNLQNSDLLSQHQFNLGLDFYLKNNVTFGVAGGFYAIEKNTKTQLYGNGNAGFGRGKRRTISSTTNNDFNLSALLFISKRFTYLIPEIAFAYSDFAYSNQFQSILQLTYYPFGNLNFYGISSCAIIVNNDEVKTKQTVFSQNIGVKLVKNLWLEAKVSYGNHLNYITELSFVVYDTYDPVKAIAGASLSYYFKNFSVTGSYNWMQKEGWVLSNSYMQVSKYLYNNHLANIILQWNF